MMVTMRSRSKQICRTEDSFCSDFKAIHKIVWRLHLIVLSRGNYVHQYGWVPEGNTWFSSQNNQLHWSRMKYLILLYMGEFCISLQKLGMNQLHLLCRNSWCLHVTMIIMYTTVMSITAVSLETEFGSWYLMLCAYSMPRLTFIISQSFHKLACYKQLHVSSIRCMSHAHLVHLSSSSFIPDIWQHVFPHITIGKPFTAMFAAHE